MLGKIQWDSVGVIVFAVIFLAVGIHRVVEFSDLGFSKFEKTTLITFHIIGCLICTAGFVLLAINAQGFDRKLMQGFFISAFLILVPVHILVGIKRHIKILDSHK